jgi:hypothetical protein
MRSSTLFLRLYLRSFFFVFVFTISAVTSLHAQMDRSEMIDQIAKLEYYLSQAEKGYQIARQGLTTIGNIKQGDFNLHNLFFQSLSLVNPSIRAYIKVADMITMQLDMVAAYHSYYSQFQHSGLFGAADLAYIYSFYTSILARTADDITELTDDLTDGDLQMNDAQRLDRIDKLYASVTALYQAFQNFNSRVQLLALQKKSTLRNLQQLSQLIQP